jgi:hypothetical protein
VELIIFSQHSLSQPCLAPCPATLTFPSKISKNASTNCPRTVLS